MEDSFQNSIPRLPVLQICITEAHPETQSLNEALPGMRNVEDWLACREQTGVPRFISKARARQGCFVVRLEDVSLYGAL